MPTPVQASGIGPPAPIPSEFLGLAGSSTLTPNGERIAQPGPPGIAIIAEVTRPSLRESGLGGSIDIVA